MRCEDGLRGAKSATATRGFETPRPVPVRNQSCAASELGNASRESPERRSKNAMRSGAASALRPILDSEKAIDRFSFWRPYSILSRYSWLPCPTQRLKSNQNSTDTLAPLYSPGSGFSGLEPRMARTAELSTEALPLDCKICTLATLPLRRMSNVTTARGANRTLGSTVLCSQLLLTRLRTASTYQAKRPPKSPPRRAP